MNPMQWAQDNEDLSLQPVWGDSGSSLMERAHGLASVASEQLISRCAAARTLLQQTAQAMQAYRAGQDNLRLSLDGLDADNLELVAQVLGRGEVSITLSGGTPARITESVMPGLWRVETGLPDAPGGPAWLEIGPLPALVEQTLAREVNARLALGEPPPGIMNAQPVLAEIADRVPRHRPGDRNHVFNFTLLPMSDTDRAYLQQMLGNGPIHAESRGYGACEVWATGVAGVWVVQYFNAMGTIILDTLEVGGVPDALLAASQDIEDSADRLHEILEAYF